MLGQYNIYRSPGGAAASGGASAAGSGASATGPSAATGNAPSGSMTSASSYGQPGYAGQAAQSAPSYNSSMQANPNSPSRDNYSESYAPTVATSDAAQGLNSVMNTVGDIAGYGQLARAVNIKGDISDLSANPAFSLDGSSQAGPAALGNGGQRPAFTLGSEESAYHKQYMKNLEEAAKARKKASAINWVGSN